MNTQSKKHLPTLLVILGATGDLMQKKIIPALYHLFRKKKLSLPFQVLGFSRRDYDEKAFRVFIKEALSRHPDVKKITNIDEFLSIFHYHKGHFETLNDYKTLAAILGQRDGEWQVCSNKLFYLAVPPNYYDSIFHHLADSGLTKPCLPLEGFTRVLVEKPFGKNLKTSENLDVILGKLFKEEQVYRIDHYLAKEMLQNVLNFRFSNNILEPSWNREHIEKIKIKFLESQTIGTRGNFYDGLGALRDVGQNHLLQMLTLITMGNPGELTPKKVREKRLEILSSLHRPSLDEIKNNTIRAQYTGYRQEKNVARDSSTETYFKIKTTLSHPAWEKVPIILEGGKGLKASKKEIIITFKHPSPCLCPPGATHFHNKVVISLEPEEEINIYFMSKKPGLSFALGEKSLNVKFRTHEKGGTPAEYTEEYEKLLLDAIEGNQLLFVGTDEIKKMWTFIDPIIEAWEQNKTPLLTYPKNTMPSFDFPEQSNKKSFKKEVGIIGLGKMGANTARLLLKQGYKVAGYNRTATDTQELVPIGLTAAYSLKELVAKLTIPRIIWLSLPSTTPEIINEVLFGSTGLIHYLEKNDIVIDGGNSLYTHAQSRHEKLAKKGIRYADVGVSGGPSGALNGACLMIGGQEQLFRLLLPLYEVLAAPNSFEFFEGYGAGHYVKMIHNGIEYGMMQSLGEGFDILKNAPYKLNLQKVAHIYDHGSVIASRLVGWLEKAYREHTDNLNSISGSVKHSGEGQWTVEEARRRDIPVPIIESSYNFRIKSAKKPSYTGQVVSALRGQFGGHEVKKHIKD